VPQWRFGRSLRAAFGVLQEAGLDAVAYDPLAAGFALGATGQHLAASWWHPLSGAVVDAHVGKLSERPGKRKLRAADDRLYQSLKCSPEEGCRAGLLEALLKWAGPDEAETSQEDGTNSRKSQRLAQQERLDDHEHQPLRGDQPLPRVVAGLLAKLIDNRRCERSAQRGLDRLTSSGSWDWILCRSSRNSFRHRGVLVVFGGTKTTRDTPDLFHHPATLRAKDLGMGARVLAWLRPRAPRFDRSKRFCRRTEPSPSSAVGPRPATARCNNDQQAITMLGQSRRSVLPALLPFHWARHFCQDQSTQAHRRLSVGVPISHPETTDQFDALHLCISDNALARPPEVKLEGSESFLQSWHYSPRTDVVSPSRNHFPCIVQNYGGVLPDIFHNTLAL